MNTATSGSGARRSSGHIYYAATKSLCRTCKRGTDAKIVFRGNEVFLEKFCSDHGRQDCLLSSSVAWFLDSLSFLAPRSPPRRVVKEVSAKGCPFDCGTCPSHQQDVYLPVLPITSACDLDCPICYTINKNDDAHFFSREDMSRILDHLVDDHEDLDIVNFTGGEPSLHPHLPVFLEMCRNRGIRRLTVSTNGLRLRSETYVRELAALDARIVLSFDTFRPETDKVLLGANTVPVKLKVLDLLEKHGVTTTLLPAIASGLNDDEVGSLFRLMMEKPNICSLELHTLAFTGQGGVGFPRSARITIPDLHQRIEAATGGRIQPEDFVPSPLAHPHCYSICYILLMDDGGWIPFTRIMSRAQLFSLLEDSLYLQPRERMEEVFRDVIDDLWADPDRKPESRAVLRTLDRALRDMFPADRAPLPLLERQSIAERCSKAIYIHSHMDEENFDLSRVMKCCVGVPEPDGTMIPTCSYNVLYRERDPRFADARMLERMRTASLQSVRTGEPRKP